MIPVDGLLCYMNPQYGFNSNLPWGIFRRAFDGWKNGVVVSGGFPISYRSPTWSKVFSAGYLRKTRSTG